MSEKKDSQLIRKAQTDRKWLTKYFLKDNISLKKVNIGDSQCPKIDLNRIFLLWEINCENVACVKICHYWSNNSLFMKHHLYCKCESRWRKYLWKRKGFFYETVVLRWKLDSTFEEKTCILLLQKNSTLFSNFSCMFLNPNNFFQL